jgi:hypothetical protein
MKLVKIIASLMLLSLHIQAEEAAPKAAEIKTEVVATPGAGTAGKVAKIEKKKPAAKKVHQAETKPAEAKPAAGETK